MNDLVSITDEGRYTNVFVRNHMVASIDHWDSEVCVYGTGEEPLETFEVMSDD